MSALAGVTERIRIGSMALCNDLRNPALLAKMIASLDLLSGGRIDVGMGAGWYEPEYRAAGIEFDSTSAAASVGSARRSRSSGACSRAKSSIFKGDHYTIDGAICRPAPGGRPAASVDRRQGRPAS